MKPINLVIKGINSYSTEQRIDFSKLTQNQVFGIFGETGSGKTTILDSIILALYGVSDRDNLQNLINVNTKDAYIEYTFSMQDKDGKERVYFVRRDFKLRNSGLKTEAILNDVKKKVTLAEMPDNVNQAILEIIGIGKKEFTKCIALPQGEFDKFLSDTPAVRKKTLAKLFDLEQFGIILNDKLKKRKESLTLNKSTLEEKISIYNGITAEAIAKTEEVLANSDIEMKKLEQKISKDKKIADNIKNELDAKKELLDLEVNLSIKNSELLEINYIEKQIDYTEKYGTFTVLNNKYNTCVEELNKLNDATEDYRQNLLKIDNDIKKKQILLEDNVDKINDLNKQLTDLQLFEEKRRLIENKISELQENKKFNTDKLVELSQNVVEYNRQLTAIKTNIADLQNSYKRIETTINENVELLNRLQETNTLKIKKDFATFLMLSKNKINPDSLAEVENFNIYDEVTSVIHDIENFEVNVRKEVSQILKNLSYLDIKEEDIINKKEELIHANKGLTEKCNELNIQITKSKEKFATIKTYIENAQKQVSELNLVVEANKKQLNLEMANLQNIPMPKDIEYLSRTLETYNEENKKLNNDLKNLTVEKQKLAINVEVGTTNIDNYKEKILQLSGELRHYNKATFQSKVDPTLLINEEDLQAQKDKVAEFKNELKALETNVQALRKKTKNFVYTKDDYQSLVETIVKSEEKLTELKVFINVNKITIDIQKQNLATVLTLQQDLDEVNKSLFAIEKLETLLSGGALIEFVSEEYMSLITDFANNYVSQISRGKYYLHYDGDFNVIDNFNGGIKRSVKTLSGGERFIVSLSLALGISQSIAVNNNKNFNFFFIDEGFGNLSENYIEKVLQSFDALIRLDFTVGFITHVEKMQNYLNSRITVSKESIDEGSIIKAYY